MSVDCRNQRSRAPLASRRCGCLMSPMARGRSPPSYALRFAKAPGQPPEYWLNLQAAHDLAAAQSTVGCAQRVERVA